MATPSTTGKRQFSSLCWKNMSERSAAQVIAWAVLRSVSPGDLERVRDPTRNLNVKMRRPGEHHGGTHLSHRYVYQKDQFTAAHVKRCNCFSRCRRGTVDGEEGRESRAAPSVPRALSQRHCLATAGTRKAAPSILSLPTHGCWDMCTHVVLCHLPR